MSKQNKILLIIGVILIIGAAIFILLRDKNTAVNPSDSVNENYQTNKVRPVDSTDHLWGDLSAPVKMIIYDDFECPFCADFYDTVAKIKQEFSDKIVIAFRHYPLANHAEALIAAQASECAGEQGKFWEMYDKLFADNKAGRMSPEQFKNDAADLGLNQAEFNQCLDTEKYKDKVLAQMLEGKNAGVGGTPTSFINGEIYPGAYPIDDFTARDGKKEEGMRNIINRLLNGG